MKSCTQFGLCVVFCVVCIISAGCGRNPYQYSEKVTGTVTCSGKPATGGLIIFQPVDDSTKTKRPRGEPGPASVGRIEADGTFVLFVPPVGTDPSRKGALIGPHLVTFQMPTATTAMPDPEAANDLPAEDAEQPKEGVEKPPVYERLDCGNAITPNTVDVKAGANKFEFTLQPGAPPNEPPMTGRKARRQFARDKMLNSAKPK